MHVLVTPENCGEHLRRFEKSDAVCADVETTGVKPFGGDQVCGVAVYDGAGPPAYFPLRHAYGQNIDATQRLHLMRVLSVPRVFKNHNLKFDSLFLGQEEGFVLPEQVEDSMLGAFIENENRPTKALKKLGVEIYGKGSDDDQTVLKEKLVGWGYGKDEMWRLPPADVAPYACQDTVLSWDLCGHFRESLGKAGTLEVWEEVNLFSVVITRMEYLGIQLDVPLIERYAREADLNAHRTALDLRRLAGFKINPNSPGQVAAFLGIANAQAETIEDLGRDREDVRAILDHKAWCTVRDRYYRPYLAAVDKNRRIRSNLKITGTVGGRISSSDPNLQAVAVRDDIFKVKDVFVADPGYALVEFDYSQAEVRLAAHYTQDPNLLRFLREGRDIHGEVAKQTGIPRDKAKRLNFSVIYGIGANTLHENLNISPSEARSYLKSYHDAYPGFRKLARRCEDLAESRGWIQMFTGRRVHFNTKYAETWKAMSRLIQGGVAEMVRVAMNRIHRELPHDEVVQLLQVHDSIFMQIRTERVSKYIPEIRAIMEDQPWCTAPITVDCKVGTSWGAMEKVGR